MGLKFSIVRRLYGDMQKLTSVLDSMNIVNTERLRVIGFIVCTVEESLKSCMQVMCGSIPNTKWSGNHLSSVDSFVFGDPSTCAPSVQGVSS